MTAVRMETLAEFIAAAQAAMSGPT